MPTTIADACCSCPYKGEGNCKHIVALLLTYVHMPDVIGSVDTLLATLAEKQKASLLRVISELLKRTPELAPIVQVYADFPVGAGELQSVIAPTCHNCRGWVPQPLRCGASYSAVVPTCHKLTVCATVTVSREQIDRLFGDRFLEQHQLHKVLTKLEGLVRHAESLAQLGETEFAMAILHALVHQSIARDPDTLQKSELPRFVSKCTKTFTQTARNAQESASIGFGKGTVPATLPEHCRMLLQLSFEAEQVFTLRLTSLLEQLCLTPETADLQTMIERHLDESPDRQAHVRLLLALYRHAGETEAYLRLAQAEGEGYRLIQALFTRQQDNVARQALEASLLSVDEYWCLLQSPIAQRVQGFPDKLLTLLRHRHTESAISLYQRLIEQTVFSRKRENYENARGYLREVRCLYQHLGQENLWTAYLVYFRKRHARKRLLLKIIAEIF